MSTLTACHIAMDRTGVERQITFGAYGHVLTNTRVWSPDGNWIVYDVRSDAAGDQFDGNRIEAVNVETGEVRRLFESKQGAHCGVATFHPHENKVVFILGPENPTPDWQYSACHRQGVIVDAARPGVIENLDARDLTPPFTPGALRGGSHVHVWDGAGEWVSFTYEDQLLSQFKTASATNEINQRNLGVSAPIHPVTVKKDHPRNHDGNFFSVLVTRTTAQPKPGSDEINRAFEESWIGTNGYVRADGRRQTRALSFQGQVVTANGGTISEVYAVDLPEDLTVAGDKPLAGTETMMPRPPAGTRQRRLTFTADRKFPGIQGPRHWLRSSPDGARIAFLMKDDSGVVQLWMISPNGGEASQLTHNSHDITSAFTWSPDGKEIAHVMDQSVCITEAATGKTRRLTQRCDLTIVPRPEACVFSPDASQIAFVQPVSLDGQFHNQIFVVTAK